MQVTDVSVHILLILQIFKKSFSGKISIDTWNNNSDNIMLCLTTDIHERMIHNAEDFWKWTTKEQTIEAKGSILGQWISKVMLLHWTKQNVFTRKRKY